MKNNFNYVILTLVKLELMCLPYLFPEAFQLLFFMILLFLQTFLQLCQQINLKNRIKGFLYKNEGVR